MPQRRLLIDLENVPTSDYTLLPADFLVTVFVGKTQTTVPVALVKMAQAWGERLILCEVSGTGKNALDMHLAFYLGSLSCADPTDEFLILSKDKGYDPLVRHLRQLNIRCSRIDSLIKLHPEMLPPKTPEQKIIDVALNPVSFAPLVGSSYEKVCLHLKKMTSKECTRKSLPSNKGTLKSHIIATFKNEIPANMYENIVLLLFREKKVIEENGKLIYCFQSKDKL